MRVSFKGSRKVTVVGVYGLGIRAFGIPLRAFRVPVRFPVKGPTRETIKASREVPSSAFTSSAD